MLSSLLVSSLFTAGLALRPVATPVVSRRAALLAPLAVVGCHQPAQAASLTRQGMQAFAAGKVEESIRIYDSIIEASPASKPYLWQRGLSLYYADRFADGAEQFAADVAVNPNDTEEQIWHLLCLSQVKGSLDAARPFKLTVGTDRRPVMRAAQALFLSGGSEAEAALADIAKNGDSGAKFYAALYLSLYYESLAEKAKAENRMKEAVATDYARGGGRSDPMVELAQVAMDRRGWAGKQ